MEKERRRGKEGGLTTNITRKKRNKKSFRSIAVSLFSPSPLTLLKKILSRSFYHRHKAYILRIYLAKTKNRNTL